MHVFHDKSPLWDLLTLITVLTFLTAILWVNAEDFDETEIRTVIMASFGLLGYKGAKAVFDNHKNAT